MLSIKKVIKVPRFEMLRGEFVSDFFEKMGAKMFYVDKIRIKSLEEHFEYTRKLHKNCKLTMQTELESKT